MDAIDSPVIGNLLDCKPHFNLEFKIDVLYTIL